MIATSRTAGPLLLLLIPLALGCSTRRPQPEPSVLRRDATLALARGEDMLHSRRWPAAATAFARAGNIFAALDDGPAEATARHGQAEALRRTGQLDAALAAHERALALDGRAGNPSAQARDLAGLAQTQGAQGDLAHAITTAEEARRLAHDAPAVAAIVDNDLATYLLARGDPADRERIVELLTSARQTNRTRQDTRSVAVNELNLARVHLSIGEVAAAAPFLATALDAFRALDDAEGLAQTHEALGMVAGLQGDASERTRHYQQARDGFAFLGEETDRRRVERRLAGE
jgi:tetratricopeptide (TPR) repeat protein